MSKVVKINQTEKSQSQKPLIFRSKGITTKKGIKRSTIAGIIENNTIKIGVAVCSTKDSFVKSKGRMIAVGRAIKHPEQVIAIVNNEAIKTFLDFSRNYCEQFHL